MATEKTGFRDTRRTADDAEETLRAIRYGTVDAFVVEEAEGHRVYALESADLPYSSLVERMQQGAAMLDAHGTVLYCNPSLARLLGTTRDSIGGRFLREFIAPDDQAFCQELIIGAQSGSSEGEMRLCRADGALTSANLSFKLLSLDRSTTGVLITDLTPRQQQRDLAARLQQMQDDERRRIARELHDSVGQLLAAISMNIAVMQSQAYKLDPTGARAVAENQQLVDQVSREIRTVSYLLHPPLLDVAGLASALRWYVDGFSERSKIKVELDLPDDLPRLPDTIEIAVFRMIQESLTNIHRHSGSPIAAISIQHEGGRLVVQVRDSGKGMSNEKLEQTSGSPRSGVGFAGMRERLVQLDGELMIQSNENGTVVTGILPVKQTAA